MASHKQLAANRRNALLSTGPKTEIGKSRSRFNAVKHGLTAETVVSMLEDRSHYDAFEAAIFAEYQPISMVERSLTSRLVSVLWRLRRATAIETGLFEIQARHFKERHRFHISRSPPLKTAHVVQGLLASAQTAVRPREYRFPAVAVESKLSASSNLQSSPRRMAQCFLRLA